MYIFLRRLLQLPTAMASIALFALITLGEGWHNNHHQFPSTARMGFRWWEFDITWYGLWVMEKLGLIWDVRPIPDRVRPD